MLRAEKANMVKHPDCDVVVIGAGAAGLAAAATLVRAGKNVRCLEATDRVGGRILTVHDPLAPLPIELGAEFVHGRPPETWDLIRTANLTAYEHTSDALHIDKGRVVAKKQVGEIADQVLSQMARSAGRKDESFEDYLRHSRQRAEVKKWAQIQVEGFNAAHKKLISVASLNQDTKAAEKIDGDRTFRIVGGYDSIPISLLHSIPDYQSVVQLNSTVKSVTWRRGFVEVQYISSFDNQDVTLRCRQIIVTVPLGVLEATPSGPGSIHFEPEPAEILQAARSLCFGQVYRITFRFRNAFWEEDDELKRVGFLVSTDKQFFTWWTTHPIMSPLLTGWAAGSAADQFLDSPRLAVASEALASLARILNRKVPRPDEIYFHDWHSDPFFRGAYSYVPVNALSARKTLAEPVDGTLLFAGEATELNGHGGTVHGAIASGLRAAALVLKAR
jgi:monoamine oxidase